MKKVKLVAPLVNTTEHSSRSQVFRSRVTNTVERLEERLKELCPDYNPTVKYDRGQITVRLDFPVDDGKHKERAYQWVRRAARDIGTRLVDYEVKGAR